MSFISLRTILCRPNCTFINFVLSTNSNSQLIIIITYYYCTNTYAVKPKPRGQSWRGMISWLRRFSHFCFKRPPVFNDSSSITRSVWIRGTDETVFALSSGHGKAGQLVITCIQYNIWLD